MATVTEEAALAGAGAGGTEQANGPLSMGALPLLAAAAAVLLTMQAAVSFQKGVHSAGGYEPSPNLQLGALSLFASLIFILFSNALLRWDPTRGMGKVLVERFTRMVRNWQHETLRSFVELFIWLGARQT